MKIRYDFVTNSSSSSFLISKKNLDEDQIEAIREHYELGKKMGMVDLKWDSPWDIEENDNYITGYTFMDNFDMYKFLSDIDVEDKDIKWGEFRVDLSNIKKDWRYLLHED